MSGVTFHFISRNHLDLISFDWHPCDTCRFYFPTKSTLNCHINSSHNASIHPNSSRNSSNSLHSVRVRKTRSFVKSETFCASSSTKRQKCSFCNMSFSDSTRYYNHANQVLEVYTVTIRIPDKSGYQMLNACNEMV